MAKTAEQTLREARAAATAGDHPEAERRYREAVRLARDEAETMLLAAHALRHVSDLARERGAGREALAAAEEAVALYRSAPSRPLDLANALRLVALAREALDELGQAVPSGAKPARCTVNAAFKRASRNATATFNIRIERRFCDVVRANQDVADIVERRKARW